MWCSYFGCIGLKIGVMFNCGNAIMKECSPKESISNDLLGSGNIGEVVATRIYVEIIEWMLNIFMSEETTEKGFENKMVKNITNKKVIVGLMANVMSIITNEVWGEFLSVLVCKKSPHQ